MKKLSLIILIPLALMCFKVKAQTKIIDSFLGVKFESTRAQVIEALKLKGAQLNKDDGDAETLVFRNVTLAGRSSEYMYVSFVGGKASMAGFVFKPELQAKTIDFYNELVADLNEVYGKGNSIKQFKSPYEEGDGDEITAIETGNADIKTFWGQDDEKQPGGILILITSKLEITLTYVDKKLLKLEQSNSKKNKQADL